jgi:hypothetical protein
VLAAVEVDRIAELVGYPREWRLLLKLPAPETLQDPREPYIGERSETLSETAPVVESTQRFDGASKYFIAKLPNTLALDLKLSKKPAPRTVHELIRDAGVKARGPEGAEHWLEPEDYQRLLEFCKGSGRPRPRAGRPANIPDSA